MMHVGITNLQWGGKHSQHSQYMNNPQFYISVKKPMVKILSLLRLILINEGFFFLTWGVGSQVKKKQSMFPDSKVHGANMGPIWGRQDPGGRHVGPMNVAIRVSWVVHSMWPSLSGIMSGLISVSTQHEIHDSHTLINALVLHLITIVTLADALML